MERPYFNLRGLLKYDSAHKLFVGYCLETGNVVTADDMPTAEDMLREVLEDEISNAIKFENYNNLFSTPAAKAIWDEWYELSKAKDPETIWLSVKNEKVTVDDNETPARLEFVGAQ